MGYLPTRELCLTSCISSLVITSMVCSRIYMLIVRKKQDNNLLPYDDKCASLESFE